MSDLGWMAVCGLSLAAMGAVYLIDRQTWRRRAHLLGLQAHAATAGIECARRGRRQQIERWRTEAMTARREQAEATGRADGFQAAMIEIHRIAAEAAGLDRGDWSRPVTVGDPDADPLYAEILLCGPSHLAVCLRAKIGDFKNRSIRIEGARITVFDGPRVVLETVGGVGIAAADDVETITDAVRRLNQSFHQAKGGEKDAGVIEEAERGDRDRPGCDDHGPGDPRRQGADRRQCADRGACASP